MALATFPARSATLAASVLAPSSTAAGGSMSRLALAELPVWEKLAVTSTPLSRIWRLPPARPLSASANESWTGWVPPTQAPSAGASTVRTGGVSSSWTLKVVWAVARLPATSATMIPRWVWSITMKS